MPFPASRSNPSIDSCRHATPQARMIVRAAQDVAAVEVHLPRRGVDPRDRPGHEDLGAEPPRLLQRAARQLVARHARREAQVVLDPRRGAGLAAGRLALDHDRAQALRCAVHGGGQPRGAGADDHRVVLGGGGVGGEAQQLGHAPQLRAHHGLAVDDADRRADPRRPAAGRPMLGRIRRVGRDPLEGDLVAVEEAPQLRAGRVPAWPTTIARGGGGSAAMALQPARSAHPVGRELADLLAEVGMRSAAIAW